MTFNRPRNLFAILGPALLSLSAAGPAATAGSSDPGQATVNLIKEFMFTPATLKIKAGTTVTWTNKDQEPHTIVGESGSFRSGAVDTDESFTFKFDKPGTYHYTCSIHPRMTGTVVVE